MALQTAASALAMASGFITDPKVKEIMSEVAKAIEYAIGRLMPHQQAAQEAARAGKPPPATAPQPSKAKATAAAPDSDGSSTEPGPDEEEEDEMASDPPDEPQA